MGHDELRKAWFPDWDPEKEDAPNGIRSLVGEGTMPVMRDPDEDESWRRASLPGGGGEVHARLYEENPYSTLMPRQLRTLLDDPNVRGEQRKQVMAAWDRLKRLEDGEYA